MNKKIKLNNFFDFVGLEGSFIHSKLKAKQFNEETITQIEDWKKNVINLCDENILFLKKYIEITKVKQELILQIYKERGLDSNSPEVIECKTVSQLKDLLK
jgi:hypothetical protein